MEYGHATNADMLKGACRVDTEHSMRQGVCRLCLEGRGLTIDMYITVIYYMYQPDNAVIFYGMNSLFLSVSVALI